jgi:hypothetical protein
MLTRCFVCVCVLCAVRLQSRALAERHAAAQRQLAAASDGTVDAMDVEHDWEEGPLSDQSRAALLSQPDAAAAVAALVRGTLGSVKAPPAKPFSPRSVAAGLAAAKSLRNDNIRDALRMRQAGRRTKADAAAAAAARAPAAKFGSVRFVAAQYGVSKSTADRISRTAASSGLSPELRGGSNRIVSSPAKSLLQLWFDHRLERDLHTDARDIDSARMLFESLIPAVGHAADSSNSSGSEDGDSTDDIEQRRRRQQQLRDRRLKPLLQPSLSRLCAELGWSRQTAQARKPARLRPSRAAELQHYRSNCVLWPPERLFCWDETQITHDQPPGRSYARRDGGGAHVRGERRGTASTLLVCASG